MMGELTFFIGLQIKQTKDGTFIYQEKYTKEVMKKFNMDNSKKTDTPISYSSKLDNDEKGKKVDKKFI